MVLIKQSLLFLNRRLGFSILIFSLTSILAAKKIKIKVQVGDKSYFSVPDKSYFLFSQDLSRVMKKLNLLKITKLRYSVSPRKSGIYELVFVSSNPAYSKKNFNVSINVTKQPKVTSPRLSQGGAPKATEQEKSDSVFLFYDDDVRNFQTIAEGNRKIFSKHVVPIQVKRSPSELDWEPAIGLGSLQEKIDPNSGITLAQLTKLQSMIASSSRKVVGIAFDWDRTLTLMEGFTVPKNFENLSFDDVVLGYLYKGVYLSAQNYPYDLGQRNGDWEVQNGRNIGSVVFRNITTTKKQWQVPLNDSGVPIFLPNKDMKRYKASLLNHWLLSRNRKLRLKYLQKAFQLLAQLDIPIFIITNNPIARKNPLIFSDIVQFIAGAFANVKVFAAGLDRDISKADLIVTKILPQLLADD